MITHYGLFWSASFVFWGKPGKGNGGQMLGRTKTRAKGRGRPTENSPVMDFGLFVGVYCLYRGDTLVYVGKAGLGTEYTLLQRLKEHWKTMNGLWDSFSWFGCETCEGPSEVKQDLKSLEAVLIAAFNPRFNRSNGSFCGAEQVFQVAHSKADGDIDTRLHRIFEAIDKGYIE